MVAGRESRPASGAAASQGGASPGQAQAFRAAVFSYMLRWWCTEPEAIAAVWNAGDWRKLTAEHADAQLDLADRPTGEGASTGAPACV